MQQGKYFKIKETSQKLLTVLVFLALIISLAVSQNQNLTCKACKVYRNTYFINGSLRKPGTDTEKDIILCNTTADIA